MGNGMSLRGRRAGAGTRERDSLGSLAKMSLFQRVINHVYVFVCILLKQPVVRLIEEASCRGLKEVRFVTWHNQYILNIKDGFQQNACFRREIKRRPLLRSCVALMPFLQYVSQQNGNLARARRVVPSLRCGEETGVAGWKIGKE